MGGAAWLYKIPTVLMSRAVFYFVTSEEIGSCPICGGALTKRGYRMRVMIAADGEKKRLSIRRLFCPQCNCIHHELPDCLVPYKRHCLETIEKAIQREGDKLKTTHDYRTIQRIRTWWRITEPYFFGILSSLVEKYKIESDHAPAFKSVVRAVVNANRWVFAHTLCTRSDAVCG
jgi:hypothetical protein